jgi:predicted transcriptional regulator
MKMDDKALSNGYVKIYRKIIQSEVFQDSALFHLAMYCILRANHKANRVLFNLREVKLERGEFITGLRQISKETGIPLRKIRTRLDFLERVGFLTRKPTRRFSIIKVCNYKFYQNSEGRRRHTKRHSDDTVTTTDKNEKNEKKSLLSQR